MISRPRFNVRLLRIVNVWLNIIFQNEPLVTYIKFWNRRIFWRRGDMLKFIKPLGTRTVKEFRLTDLWHLHCFAFTTFFLPRSISLHVPLQFYCHFVFLTSSLTFAVLYSCSSCIYFEMSLFVSRLTHLSSKIHVDITRKVKQREREDIGW
jgi:hypothetical protein